MEMSATKNAAWNIKVEVDKENAAIPGEQTANSIANVIRPPKRSAASPTTNFPTTAPAVPIARMRPIHLISMPSDGSKMIALLTGPVPFSAP